MKNFYLATDSYSFYTHENYFLAVLENDKIININKTEKFKENVVINNIDNYVGSGESFDYNAYIVEADEELIPFYYSLEYNHDENLTEEQRTELIIDFNKDTSIDYVIKVMNIISKTHNENYPGIKISYRISDKNIFYTTVEEVNRNFIKSNVSLMMREDGEIIFPSEKEEVEYISELREKMNMEPLSFIPNPEIETFKREEIDEEDIPF
jgi:hypothetical protein